MPVKRSLWVGLFQDDAFPGLPCPQCENGKLKLVADSYYKEEPAYSLAAHRADDWEPDWITQRFSARMKCDEQACQEIVIAAGDTQLVQTYEEDEEGYNGWAFQEVLHAQSFFPAPPLFRIPENTPYDVRKQIQLAFTFFWSDLSSSVGRLRTAVELMLNEQGIPSEKLTKKGKMVRMDLSERIDGFAATVTGDDTKDALHGLRYIGNLGTHSTGVTPEAFFDAADVLEDILLGIYQEKSLKAKIKKLNDKKGKY